MGSIKYNSLALFVSPREGSGDFLTGDINQLHRIQSTNYDIELTRVTTEGMGTARVIENTVPVPLVNFSFNYLVSDGWNEGRMGLCVDGKHNAFYDSYSREKEFYLLANSAGNDYSFNFGHCVLNKYSVNATVGDFVRASAGYQGLNLEVTPATTGGSVRPSLANSGSLNSGLFFLPKVSDGIFKRDVGQIESNLYVSSRGIDLSIPSMAGFAALISGNENHIQGFNLDVNISRADLQRLGSSEYLSRSIKFPIDVAFSAELVLTKNCADELQRQLCLPEYDISLNLLSNKCSDYDETWNVVNDKVKMAYIMKKMKLRTISSSASVSEKVKLNLTWGTRVFDSCDTFNALIISGDFGKYGFYLNEETSISGNQSVTGQGLGAINSMSVYKRAKQDIEFPDYSIDFSGDFNVDVTDYYNDRSIICGKEIYDISGKFGQNITKDTFYYRADGFTAEYTENNKSECLSFGNVKARYAVGFFDELDHNQTNNTFYIKSEGLNSGIVNFDFGIVPDYLKVWTDFEEVNLDPKRPYFMNSLNVSIKDSSIPTGSLFSFDVVTHDARSKRVYRFSGHSEYEHHLMFPSKYSGKFDLWMDPYRDDFISFSGAVSSILDESKKGRSLSGSAQLNQQNGFPILSLSSTDSLSCQDLFHQDFRNFSVFILHKPTALSPAGSLIKFYNNSGDYFSINTTGTSGCFVSKTSGSNSSQYNMSLGGWVLSSFLSSEPSGLDYRENNVSKGVVPFDITNTGDYRVRLFGSGYVGDVAEVIVSPYRFYEQELDFILRGLDYKWKFLT